MNLCLNSSVYAKKKLTSGESNQVFKLKVQHDCYTPQATLSRTCLTNAIVVVSTNNNMKMDTSYQCRVLNCPTYLRKSLECSS